MLLRFFIYVGIFLTSLSAISQSPAYPKNYFRNPLDIPMQLAANFGELRYNHWHMGLDIRTNRKENLPVYAAAAGYISKVRIEPGGFGRVIFINHPNGFTTVYAHLNNFAPSFHEYVVNQQYKLESWQVELDFPPNQFPVQKGQLIAYSGNTGGSQGPHLHFEIRETKTTRCLNPLLFGLPLEDNVPPSIVRIAQYDRGRSVYEQTPKLLPVKKTANGYTTTAPVIKTGLRKTS
ncbi:MAG: M23 family metallopeptidase, partial [Chitinophagaceae bacterium]|nr:M23 family metallopeptidase [Chitinophagaceae bacterium]